jgi:YbbR domain-containing protein
MRRLLRSHWQLKLLSLLLAVVLWVVVIREEKIVSMVNAPVELTNIPRDMVVANEVEELISVKLRGAKSLVLGFVPAQIELPQGGGDTRLRVGENHIRIDPKGIGVPRGIEVLGVTPSSLRVVLERLVTKELAVEPRLEGSPPRGFGVRRVTATPSKVMVRGPERTLRVTGRIATEPISVENKTEAFRKLVYLESPGNHISWEEGEAFPISVLVEIVRK